MTRGPIGSAMSAARGAWSRVLQLLALWAPGAESVRPMLHRLRGVRMGRGVSIGIGVILEPARPELLRIGDNVSIGIRATILGYSCRTTGERLDAGVTHTVVLEDDAFIGPGALILPNVTIGTGAVVDAGSVVTADVDPHVMVRGNPAQPVATCRVALTSDVPQRAFLAGLRPLRPGSGG